MEWVYYKPFVDTQKKSHIDAAIVTKLSHRMVILELYKDMHM